MSSVAQTIFGLLESTAIAAFLTFLLSFATPAQSAPGVRSQEVSDDGVPVLLKHLPNWETVKDRAVFARTAGDLRDAIGDHPVLDLVEFSGGTEAVTAPYPQGRLLIIEYTSPQASVDADNRFRQLLVEIPRDTPVAYRRIGNYSVFVFDAHDQVAAGSLLDEVRYEKTIQWLGEDPFMLRKLERYFVTTTRDIFVSTVLFILIGIGVSIVAGLGVGYIYFRMREQKRAGGTAFSDAGGLTRLNLDDLSEPVSNK